MVWKIKIAHKGLLDQCFLKTLWLDRFYFLLTIIWNKIASILQKELHSIENRESFRILTATVTAIVIVL